MVPELTSDLARWIDDVTVPPPAQSRKASPIRESSEYALGLHGADCNAVQSIRVDRSTNERVWFGRSVLLQGLLMCQADLSLPTMVSPNSAQLIWNEWV